MINFYGIAHFCGGCGTEMFGALELLRSKGVNVRCIVPEDDDIIDPKHHFAAHLLDIGVELVCYKPGMFKECNVLLTIGEEGVFDLMRKYNDRPRYSIFSACMYYATDTEITSFKDGLIDEFFFQNSLHGDRVGPTICRNAHRAVPYRPGYLAYFPINSGFLNVPNHQKPTDCFRVGKIGRDDPDKYHPETWKMFSTIVAPDMPVRVEVLGWGDRAESKIGNPCIKGHKYNADLNLQLFPHIHDTTELADFWSRQHALLHICDWPWEESCGRVILEAMASGVVPITDNRGGPSTFLQNGVTGWLVDSWEEAAFRSSEMAFYPEKREEMARAGFEWLKNDGFGNPDRCWPWWEYLVKKGT
jgi:glycosyltransferase involved in cell wall biosynthesis